MIRGAIASRQRSIVPGFGLSLGVTLSYLGLIVIIPLCVLLLKASDAGWAKIWMELSSLRTLAAFRVSFGTAFLAAVFNAPKELAIDRRGNLLIVDTENHAIREIDLANGTVVTVAGEAMPDSIAMALPEATEEVTWGTDINFRVRKKI